MPDFEVMDQDGNKVSSKDLIGKKTIIYFYPKDNTSGCTDEACNIRDNHEALIARGYNVVGVSKDSVNSHKKFKERHNLPFTLLSDTSTEMLQAFGAWGEKNQWFYYAKDMKNHIGAVDDVLMNSVNKGVLLSGTQAKTDNQLSSCIVSGTSWRELADISGDALVGCFNYQGKTALYVVNYDMENAQYLNLNFRDSYDFHVVQNGVETQQSGSALTLSMNAGEGVLIVFE